MTRIIGHRGARGLYPENTIEGFSACLERGWREFELDVGVTKDGQVVVHHDLALNPDIARLGERWPAGSLPLLREMTYEDIAEFDVGRICPGTPTAERFPHQQSMDGARIPLLSDVLALDAEVWIIELKLQPDRPDWTVPPEEMVERTLQAAEAAGALDRIVIQSFDWRAPRHAGRIRPGIPRAWLTRPDTEADPALWWDLPSETDPAAGIAAEGGATWSAYWETLTAQHVKAAHARGLEVLAWTVNDAATMRRLAGMQVDGIITDYPDRWTARS